PGPARACFDDEYHADDAALPILLFELGNFGVHRLGDLLGDETSRIPGEIAEQEHGKHGKNAQIDQRQLERGRAQKLAEGRHSIPPSSPKWGGSYLYCVISTPRRHSGALESRFCRLASEPGIHNPRRGSGCVVSQLRGLWLWIPGSARGACARTAHSADPSAPGPGMTK